MTCLGIYSNCNECFQKEYVSRHVYTRVHENTFLKFSLLISSYYVCGHMMDHYIPEGTDESAK